MTQAQKPSLTRRLRGFLNRLDNLRSAQGPDAPALSLRDPWPGDPSRGARLVKAELEFAGAVLAMPPDIFAPTNATRLMRAHLHGFSWLQRPARVWAPMPPAPAPALWSPISWTPKSPTRSPRHRMSPAPG